MLLIDLTYSRLKEQSSTKSLRISFESAYQVRSSDYLLIGTTLSMVIFLAKIFLNAF